MWLYPNIQATALPCSRPNLQQKHHTWAHVQNGFWERKQRFDLDKCWRLGKICSTQQNSLDKQFMLASECHTWACDLFPRWHWQVAVRCCTNVSMVLSCVFILRQVGWCSLPLFPSPSLPSTLLAPSSSYSNMPSPSRLLSEVPPVQLLGYYQRAANGPVWYFS